MRTTITILLATICTFLSAQDQIGNRLSIGGTFQTQREVVTSIEWQKPISNRIGVYAALTKGFVWNDTETLDYKGSCGFRLGTDYQFGQSKNWAFRLGYAYYWSSVYEENSLPPIFIFGDKTFTNEHRHKSYFLVNRFL